MNPKSAVILCLVLVTPWAHANFVISVTDVPTTLHGEFSASVVGGASRVPNPCYATPECRLNFYTINEGWLPGGRGGYETVDIGWVSSKPVTEYQYLNDWWRDVTNKTRVGRDYLPEGMGDQPCVVVAAGVHSLMLLNTIVSNCARGVVQVPDCKILTPSLSLDFGTTQPGGGPVAQTAVSFQCSDTTARTLTIQTNTDELIPLGGSATLKAQLDWGAGYGKPGKIRIQGTQNLTLHGRLFGLDTAQPGLFQGSAVVNISYE